MKAEVRLKTTGTHSVLLLAESEAEKKLLQIFEGEHDVAVRLIQPDSYYYSGYSKIEGVRIELTPKVTP